MYLYSAFFENFTIYMCVTVCVEVRGQLCGVRSLIYPLLYLELESTLIRLVPESPAVPAAGILKETSSICNFSVLVYFIGFGWREGLLSIHQ